MASVKEQLYQCCLDHINQRIVTVHQAIHEAQASSNDETKSSAGDKYETGRAMAHLEIEKNNVQLEDAVKLRQKLEALGGKKPTETIQAGSLVMTSQGNFYLSVPAGQWIVDHKTYFAISTDSPIGARLMGLKKGSLFEFRNKEYKIIEVG